MSQTVPTLALSLGQVLWCLAGGQKPPEGSPLPAQIRYLRQLGIPHDSAEKGVGRGGRQKYDFYELIELGIAWEALRKRIEPRYLKVLAEDRYRFRSLYRETYKELAQDPSQFEDPPGTPIGWFGKEYFLRLHDRYSKSPGFIRPVLPEESPVAERFGKWVEQYEDTPDREVIPLKQAMVSLLRLARIAPATRPGPGQ